jgi:hypothetical protein
MSFLLLKVNNPSICHPIWPRLASRLAPVGHPVRPPSGPPSGSRWAPVGHPVRPPVWHLVWPPLGRKINKFKLFFYFFGCCCQLEKRGKNISVFGFQSPRSPRSPRSPSSANFAGKAARRRRFFRPSFPSHPSKLYSCLGWLNSKVPKPFFPFTLRLIDVDGF